MRLNRKSLLLYAVTGGAPEGYSLPQAVEAALKGGVTFLQLREKGLSHAALVARAVELKALAARYGVPFVVNDHVEAALESGADGVHVGQSDLDGRDYRALLGPHRILGVSANTVQAALAAQEMGADYLGVGAVFPTATKGDAKALSLDTLREICRAVDIPVVAIGGIGPGNILRLRGSGVDGVAVVSALFSRPDPGAAAEELLTNAREVVRGHG